MTTEKERELIAEITSLALDIGADEYNVGVHYSGHIHALHVRVAKKSATDWVYYGDAIYLSGREDIWGPKQSIKSLEEALIEVKKYHPQYDADGVKL